MLNIMRADTYRIFRGKGIYIASVIFLLLILLRVFSNVFIGIDTGARRTLEEGLANTGANAPFMAMADAGNFMYFILPLVIFIAAADFSSGCVKNILAGGISRTKYFMSKLILACVLCAAALVLNIVVSVGITTAINGFGGTFDAQYLTAVLKPFGLQLFLSAAAVCVAMFLTFTVKSTGGVTGIYIAWLFVPLMLVFMLTDISESFARLAYYDFTFNIQALADFNALTADDILRSVFIGAFYIIACTVFGIILFRRSEIK